MTPANNSEFHADFFRLKMLCLRELSLNVEVFLVGLFGSRPADSIRCSKQG
jgi:hypothetical protein